MQELFNMIRESSEPSLWSRSASIARRIILQEAPSSSEGEKAFYLVLSGEKTYPKVSLWLEDADWACSCSLDEDPCEHVISLVIALKHGKKVSIETKQIPTAQIGYRFVEEKNELKFFRVVVLDCGKEEKLSKGLLKPGEQKLFQHILIKKTIDFTFETLILPLEGELPRTHLPILLKTLSKTDEVKLNGKKITVSAKPKGFILSLEENSSGLIISSKQDPEISKVYKNGFVLAAGSLHPLQKIQELPSDVLSYLKEKKTYLGTKESQNFLAENFTLLSKKLSLNLSEKLREKICELNPRIRLHSKRTAKQLQIEAELVYGDEPILAKVCKKSAQLLMQSEKIVLRKLAQEKELIYQYEKKYDCQWHQPIQLEKIEAVLFLEKLKKEKEDLVASEACSYFSLYPPLELKAKTSSFDENSKNDLSLELASHHPLEGKKTLAARSLLHAWQKNETYVSLLGGGFAPIPLQWKQEYGETLLNLLAACDEKGRLPRACQTDLNKLEKSLLLEADHQEGKEQVKLKELSQLLEIKADDELEEIKAPDFLKAKLRPYQLAGYQWLKKLKSLNCGAILADDMGLGKTLQTLSILEKGSLVIVPAGLIYNWEKELSQFRPDLSFCTYHAKQRNFKTDCDVLITSYSLLRIELERFQKIPWKIIVIDEAHVIKNPKSQTAQALYSLEANFKLALSGTPIENSLEDLWSLFNFTNKGFLGPYRFFQENFSKAILAGDREKQIAFQERIKPFILRRLKSKVAQELPQRTDKNLYCTLSEKEQELYDSLLLTTRQEVLNKIGASQSVMQILEALLRLRQAVCHPSLVPGQSAESSTKIKCLLQELEKCQKNKQKVLIFSQWTSFLDLIEVELKDKKYAWLRIDGKTKNRAEIISQFQADNFSQPILLLSLKAAGTGLNLTAAEQVFILDPWWNPAVEEQAADRIHRIGQNKPVVINRLIAKDSIEEKILTLKEQKHSLAKNLLELDLKNHKLKHHELLNLIE